MIIAFDQVITTIARECADVYHVHIGIHVYLLICKNGLFLYIFTHEVTLAQ